MAYLRQHKLMVYLLKILPVVMTVSYLLNALGALIGQQFQILTHYIGLLSPMLFMYISSHVFKFCSFHRLFIYYIAVVELLRVIDWYFRNPGWSIFHYIATGLLALGVIIYTIKKKCYK